MAPSVAVQPEPAPWSFSHRFVFRFLFLYLGMFGMGSTLLSDIPGFDNLTSKFDAALVSWTAAHILRLRQTVTDVTSGSGDTTFAYVDTLGYLLISLAGTTLWSAIDRR